MIKRSELHTIVDRSNHSLDDYHSKILVESFLKIYLDLPDKNIALFETTFLNHTVIIKRIFFLENVCLI